MSKSTKIIAGLGVAAALGVAALPMASFAANYSVTVPVQATVANGVKIEVKDMNATPSDWVAAQQPDADGTNAFADLTAVNFGSSLAPGVGVSLLDQTEIRVTTNYPSGYTLSAVTTDLTGDPASSIADFESVTAVNASGNTTSGWGIQVAKNGTALAAFVDGATTGYKGANGQIDSVNGLTGLTTNVYVANYGINIAASQAAGTYSGSATYTVASDANLNNSITPVE
ncbi:MAG: hypothetical protein Q4A25_01900 [Candidatus Saccharibacteria bacterium]|nr:hypothetical protein [Candidatus Saccharibacteria bacterium]